MKPRTKFAIGGVFVLGTAAFLMATSIGETAVYYLTPNELAAKVVEDPSFYGTGVKVGGRVVPGTIQREEGGRLIRFVVTDTAQGGRTFPVVYRGVAPDTFTDGVDVVVEGRLGEDGTFQATTLLAKCASRYENAPEYPGDSGGQPGGHPAGAGGYTSPGTAPAAPAPAPTAAPGAGA
ncbi:MAG TPA: cytochrome c maturation protein CcmE [Gemmatimonadales bacterium]